MRYGQGFGRICPRTQVAGRRKAVHRVWDLDECFANTGLSFALFREWADITTLTPKNKMPISEYKIVTPTE